MKVQFREIKDAGSLEHERVILDVREQTTCINYIVIRTYRTDEFTMSSKVEAAFWMTDVKVEAGDVIAIYTRAGKDRKRTNPGGSSTIFFYWGREEPVWGPTEAVSAIVEIGDYDARFRREFSALDLDDDTAWEAARNIQTPDSESSG